MKWLFLSPEFPPSTKTGAIRPSKFFKFMRKTGEDITVLTYDDIGLYGGIIANDDSILRVKKRKVPFINDSGFNFCIFNFFKFFKVLKKKKTEIIFVSVPVFLPMILAFLAKKICGVDYCLDYRDLWAGDPYPAVGIKDRMLRKVARCVEPMVMSNARLVTFVSDNMMQDQLKLYPDCKGNFQVVSTGFDEDDMCFSNSDIQIASKKYSNHISHVGMLDSNMNVDDVITLLSDERVQSFLDKNSLKFLFVGSKTSTITDVLPQSILDKYCDVVGAVSKYEALLINKSSHLSLILGSNSAQRLNRKVFEVVRLSKRVFYIGNVNSPTAKVIKYCNSGNVISGGSGDLVECFIGSLIKDERKTIHNNIKDFNKVNLVARFMKFVNGR